MAVLASNDKLIRDMYMIDCQALGEIEGMPENFDPLLEAIKADISDSLSCRAVSSITLKLQLVLPLAKNTKVPCRPCFAVVQLAIAVNRSETCDGYA